MQATLCPVCVGKRIVPGNFYPDLKKKKSEWVTCRSCYGLGYLTLPDYYYSIPYYPNYPIYPTIPYPYIPTWQTTSDGSRLEINKTTVVSDDGLNFGGVGIVHTDG